MLQGSVGLMIALVLTTLLAYQASRANPGTRLRQAYWLATTGFAIIIVINFLYLIGVTGPAVGNTIGLAAVALLIGATAAFVMALFNGEFQAKIREAHEYTADERDRIAQRRFERERATVEPPDHYHGGDQPRH